ncbi:MAG: hypothetical protein H0W86_07495 [Armatimonadetes bacterium]|nr:hypothetical protein [Armatimonadota bacterium]
MFAGFVATLAMTALMYMGPMMGMPKMDIAGMLGSLFNGMEMVGGYSLQWWMGIVLHFINGAIIFPLIYVFILHQVLPGPNVVKGMTWGFILFVLAQVMVMPMMGMGFFTSAAPNQMMMVMGSLIGHLLYGAVFGGLAAAAQPEGATLLEAQ